MSDATVRVGIVYPADPLGSIPGGIESFIRGIVRCAPADIDISVVGVTTDAKTRPVGQWTKCILGSATFQHFPICEVTDPGHQKCIPATVRFIGDALQYLQQLRRSFDVLEFHRVEPIMLFLGDPTPKTAVFHQNMDVIRSAASDIRWRYVPRLYFGIESVLIKRLASVFCVREDAVQAYRDRYPQLASRFRFTPTWMDPDVFYPMDDHMRASLRDRLLRPYGVRESDRVLITVGRLDQQKDPILLATAFAELSRGRTDVRLVFVGDGILRADTEALFRSHGIADRVLFAGLVPPPVVAQFLNASDLFVLASAYEGMPMSALEALGCGLPVCSTDVGEIRRAVKSGVNGEIVVERTATALARSLANCLDHLTDYRGLPAIEAVRDFVPEKVLLPLYSNYRRLADANRTLMTLRRR